MFESRCKSERSEVVSPSWPVKHTTAFSLLDANLREKSKDLAFIITSVYRVAWNSGKGSFLVVGGVLLMSVRQLISRVNINTNTIRRSSSSRRRARQHKGVQSAEVNLWKRLM